MIDGKTQKQTVFYRLFLRFYNCLDIEIWGQYSSKYSSPEGVYPFLR